MTDTVTTFSRAEKELLALPVPCLALPFLYSSSTDEVFAERAELLGYVGPLAIVKEQTTGCLRALLRMLGAIE